MFEIKPGGDTDKFYGTEGPIAATRIGYVRMDFGSGNEFWTTWWPGNADEECNTAAFKEELTSLIDHLRKDLLHSSRMASKTAEKLELPHIDGDQRYYGCHILTGLHEYCLRLYPGARDYSYLYCYRRVETGLPDT